MDFSVKSHEKNMDEFKPIPIKIDQFEVFVRDFRYSVGRRSMSTLGASLNRSGVLLLSTTFTKKYLHNKFYYTILWDNKDKRIALKFYSEERVLKLFGKDPLSTNFIFPIRYYESSKNSVYCRLNIITFLKTNRITIPTKSAFKYTDIIDTFDADDVYKEGDTGVVIIKIGDQNKEGAL